MSSFSLSTVVSPVAVSKTVVEVGEAITELKHKPAFVFVPNDNNRLEIRLNVMNRITSTDGCLIQ